MNSEKALAKNTNGSDALPALPDIRDRKAWLSPASREQTGEAVAMVLTLLQDDPSSEHVAALTETIQRRGYSQAEMAFAAQELLYDERLDRKLSFPGGKVTAADFEKHVMRLRQLRARLEMPLRLDDVNAIIADFPEWLSWKDFGIADYTAANTPLYRFSFSGKVDGHAPKPVLYDNERPGADRTEGTGLSAIGDLL